jgi:hypothetical protein
MTWAEQGVAASPVGPIPLKPHRYPAWLLAFTALVIGAFVYSATLITPYVKAFVALRRAEAAISARDRTVAEARLLDVLRLFPSSKSARVGIAVLLVADPSETQQRRGLDYLDGIKLNKYEWQRVSAVLPEKFRDAFISVER